MTNIMKLMMKDDDNDDADNDDDENSHPSETGCTSESKWRDFLNEVSLKSPAIMQL